MNGQTAIGCDVYNQTVTGQTAVSLTAATGGANTSGPKVIVFTQNQREEVRDLGDVAGSLASEPGIHQQTYVCVGSE